MRRHHYHYGRDPGLLGTRKRKVIAGLAVLGAGAAAFFLTKKAQAAPPQPQPAPGPAPTVPATPGGTPAVPVAPPVPTTADLGKVLTHDPPPSGDLNVFDAPNGNRVGGAEKDTLVSINSNDGTFANITTHNTGGRYPDITGFVHAQFLGAPDAQSLGTAAAGSAIDTLKSIASALTGS